MDKNDVTEDEVIDDSANDGKEVEESSMGRSSNETGNSINSSGKPLTTKEYIQIKTKQWVTILVPMLSVINILLFVAAWIVCCCCCKRGNKKVEEAPSSTVPSGSVVSVPSKPAMDQVHLLPRKKRIQALIKSMMIKFHYLYYSILIQHLLQLIVIDYCGTVNRTTVENESIKHVTF